jgi:2-C-methyl-D-erythritol 4-phosphate cytidylyltransferase
MKCFAVVVAAGSSRRCEGAVPKQYRRICGRPLLAWTLSRFEAASSIDKVVLVVGEEAMIYVTKEIVDQYGCDKVLKVVPGGAERQESVRCGLEALPISTSLVAIHDGARPVVSPGDIDRTVATASREGAAILAEPATDTIKHVRDGFIISTLDRDTLYRAQTPQVFSYDLILEAHRAAADNQASTDDAALIEARGFKVRIVPAESPNPKVTTPDDLDLIEALLRKEGHG